MAPPPPAINTQSDANNRTPLSSQNSRISCAHQHNPGTPCSHGRIEVMNSQNQWGTVCGHWFWDNDEPANIVCRQLGCEMRNPDHVICTFSDLAVLRR